MRVHNHANLTFDQIKELDALAERLGKGMEALERSDIDAERRVNWYRRWLELLDEYETKCVQWGVSPERGSDRHHV